MTDTLARLAIALPLVCLAAVAVLVAAKALVKRGGWPGRAAAAPPLDVLGVSLVGPTARLAVVRFGGATHLVGIGPQALTLLATAPVPTSSPQPPEPDQWPH